MSESENLWGGRFTGAANETFTEFNNSFKFDRRLFSADVRASIAYCDGLFHAGVVTRLEAERIKNGLSTILKRADYNKNTLTKSPPKTFIRSSKPGSSN